MSRTSSGVGTSRIKFLNPPINELVLALYHLPILELKAQHIGLYWDQIRDSYPLCEQRNPIVTPQDQQPPVILFEAPGEYFPLPRFWFYSNLHQLLIQVQRNAFMLNWRRNPEAPQDDYPHYEAVAERFWKELEKYTGFVQDSAGGKLDIVQRCELTYVNILGSREGITAPDQLPNVVPLIASLYGIQGERRTISGLQTTLSCRIDPTLVVDIAVRLGKRTDTQEFIAALELKAYGTPSDLSLDAARLWYDSAHDAIYQLFLDISNKQVQHDIWKPR